MALLAPDGPCFTGGTHAGNPFAVAIGLRVLDWLEERPEAYAAMNGLAVRLAAGIGAILDHAGCDFAVVQLESIVDFKFRRGAPTRNDDDARAADAAAYAAYYHFLRERGVLLPPHRTR